MSTCPQYTLKSQDVDKFTINTLDMYLSKSNFIFPCSAPTNGQERTMKKHMLKYIPCPCTCQAPSQVATCGEC
jgi:hypothetical protein